MKGFASRRPGMALLVLFVIALAACATPGDAANSAPSPGAAALPNTAYQAVTPSTGATVQADETQTSSGSAPAVTTPVTQASATPLVAADAATAVPAAAASATPEAASGASVTNVTGFPDPASYTWAPIVSGLQQPLDLADPGDGSGRFFVLEQAGVIRIVQNGQVGQDAFLDIRSKVGSQSSEQGLLGIALHPRFRENGYFYLNYTDQNGDTVIARYQVADGDPNHADPNSEKVLLTVDQPFPNHNGGSMVFGPDGLLYMGLGDGGSQGDPRNNAQSTDTLLGKLLRIDVDGGDPYAIPSNNPFAGGGGTPEIWAWGLRNPWRFSFDRSTGDLYIADVGQNQWEEIDFLPAGSAGGANFGWSLFEGTHTYKGSPQQNVSLIDPIFEYQHGLGCSVTGGFVYRGRALPAFQGLYLFSDYCSGRVWGLLHAPDGAWQSQVLFETNDNVSSFGQDAAGELYLIDQGSGSIYRLQQK